MQQLCQGCDVGNTSLTVPDKADAARYEVVETVVEVENPTGHVAHDGGQGRPHLEGGLYSKYNIIIL